MNILKPRSSSTERVRILEGSALEGQGKYLCDESRRQGTASSIAFPTTTEQVVQAVVKAGQDGLRVTASGARTGIAAGAVPNGGMLISLERMTTIRGLRTVNDTILVRCQCGVLLSDLQDSVRTGAFADSATWDRESRNTLERLKEQRLFYPPDPTEMGAAIGGTVACNASGAHTFRYGATRPHVTALTIVLMDGRVLEIERGSTQANAQGRFGLEEEDDSVRWCQIPTYPWPNTKNAAGYYVAPDLDLIDLFIGSEGTLGVITEVEVRLARAPETSCAVMTFWHSEAEALRFTRAARERKTELGLEAIEYFGPRALRMLRRRREELGAVSGVPECVPASADCAIYLDVGAAANCLQPALAQLADVAASCGADPEQCWTALARDERERLRIFRHALPETVNGAIAEIRRRHPGVTKLGTDMAVPDDRLADIMRVYREKLEAEKLDYVIFGHIGNNHLHVNILPRNPEEYARGWELYHEFAETVVAMGGSPAAEHGIGKLKTDFLVTLYGEEGVAQMRAVKALFDPENRLGVGTLFDNI